MRAAKRAALEVLAKSAETYNCWACLDEAVRGDEEDGFSHDLIESEREMLADSILAHLHALRKLGSRYGIVVEVHGVDMRHWEVGE